MAVDQHDKRRKSYEGLRAHETWLANNKKALQREQTAIKHEAARLAARLGKLHTVFSDYENLILYKGLPVNRDKSDDGLTMVIPARSNWWSKELYRGVRLTLDSHITNVGKPDRRYVQRYTLELKELNTVVQTWVDPHYKVTWNDLLRRDAFEVADAFLLQGIRPKDADMRMLQDLAWVPGASRWSKRRRDIWQAEQLLMSVSE